MSVGLSAVLPEVFGDLAWCF